MINIENKKKCCGCQSCYNVCPKGAITMVDDDRGFKYPKVDEEKCINCGLCEKVCPILVNSNIKNTPKAYACVNLDEKIRMQSSSGGIFTVIAEYIIDNGGVVFGAAWNSDFSKVEHVYVENKNDLSKIRGAKYLQSDINKSYLKVKEFLEADRYVLFSGTPCQIEALKLFLGRDYDKLYLQDIICHGVPSPKVWNVYKKFKEAEKGEATIKNVQFRSKDPDGWNRYHVKMQFSNNKLYDVEHGKDIYMKAFLSNISLRDSCTNCEFKKENRVSDITLADFWGINNIKPNMNDEKGTSLVIVNLQKGSDLLKKVKDEIKIEEVDFNIAIKPNPSMNHISRENPKTDEFFERLNTMPFNELVSKYVPKSSLLKRCFRKIKKIMKK